MRTCSPTQAPCIGTLPPPIALLPPLPSLATLPPSPSLVVFPADTGQGCPAKSVGAAGFPLTTREDPPISPVCRGGGDCSVVVVVVDAAGARGGIGGPNPNPAHPGHPPEAPLLTPLPLPLIVPATATFLWAAFAWWWGFFMTDRSCRELRRRALRYMLGRCTKASTRWYS